MRTALLAFAMMTFGLTPVHAAESPPGLQPREQATQITPDDHALGKKSAPVTIFEYSSSPAPIALISQTKALPVIKKDYIETGKVRLAFHFPLDGVAIKGRPLARCAEPDKFFNIVDFLFEPTALKAEQQGSGGSAGRHGNWSGISPEKQKACQDDEAMKAKIIQICQEGSQAFNIDTFTIVIVGPKGNHEVVKGAQKAEDYTKIIDKMLADQ